MAIVQRDSGKERYWRHQVGQWRRSGLSVRAFCGRFGLSEPSFYAWRRVLAERQRKVEKKSRPALRDGRVASVNGGKSGGTRGGAARRESGFVPVRLVSEPVGVSALEVVLRGGRVVRVASGFAAGTLREVVAVLEELPC